MSGNLDESMISRKIQILIVDDDKHLVKKFKNILEEADFYVDVYDKPTSALTNYKPAFYDLLIIDIRMPLMNGFVLYNKIKLVDPNILKVCFLAHFESYFLYLAEQYNLENCCFISKSISKRKLINKITQFIST
ncbi:MAG TPA: response regulator [Nitrososphaeraceae archaeon]|nr:response regulator [Nitrososphaeraceae archaeon]